MRGVVSEIKSTIQTQVHELGVLQTHIARPDEPVELSLGRPLGLQLSDTNEVIEL